MSYNSKKVIYYLTSYSLVALFLFGCTSDFSTGYIKLVSADTRESGEITISNVNNLVGENHIGDIIINSSSNPGPIKYSLYKVVKAKTVVAAQAHFDDITLESTIDNDSLKCSISAPNNSEYVQYLCGLSLNISNKMPCYIKSPNRGVYTNYMDTTLYVLDSSGSIEIEKHSGSCVSLR